MGPDRDQRRCTSAVVKRLGRTIQTKAAAFKRNNLKHLQLRTASHMSMSDQIDQSVNSSIDPSDEGDQTKDESIISPGDVFCDVCEVQAVKFCQTCTQSYCETHVRKHYTVPQLQRHTLVEVTGDLEERLCQEHHRALEVFCRTDQKLICSLCAVTEHKGHDVVYEEIKQAGRQKTQGEEQHQNQVLNEVLPAPDQLTVNSVDTTSAAVSWSQPPGLDQTQHHYQISYHCPGTEPHITTTSSHSITLSDLQPATEYSVTVCTVL